MKALTLVLCILALLGSAASGYFWWQIGDTKNQLQTSLNAEQSRASGLQAELDTTSESLETTKARLLAESTELGDTKSKLTSVEARYVQATRENASLKSALAAQEESERKLNNDLDTIRRELVQSRLAAQVGNPEEIERYQQTIAALESRLASVQSGGSVDSSAINIAGRITPNMSERTAGARVATVGNRNAFVVLDLNKADGVAVGQKYTIARTGETIAEAVISDVTDAFAIAQVVPSSIKSSLRAGDIASYTK